MASSTEYARYTGIAGSSGGSGAGVSSLNTLTGAVTIAAGPGVSVSVIGNDIFVSASYRSAIVALAMGVASFTVTYSTPLAAPGVPVISFMNVVDATPIFLQGDITANTVNGFTVLLNVGPDTANYSLNYFANEAQ
jgi:hypothetical protein